MRRELSPRWLLLVVVLLLAAAWLDGGAVAAGVLQ